MDDKWISVKAVPLGKEDCLILFSTGEIRRYFEKDWPPATVTHWMPLPERKSSPSIYYRLSRSAV